MIVDSTLAFAARRNIPVRYSRDLVATTLKAMERIAEIRAKRQRVFYKNRMAGKKLKEKLENAKLVAENEHMLPRARVELEEKMEGVVQNPLVQATERVAVVAAEKPAQPRRQTHKAKQRLLVGGGVETRMEVG